MKKAAILILGLAAAMLIALPLAAFSQQPAEPTTAELQLEIAKRDAQIAELNKKLGLAEE